MEPYEDKTSLARLPPPDFFMPPIKPDVIAIIHGVIEEASRASTTWANKNTFARANLLYSAADTLTSHYSQSTGFGDNLHFENCINSLKFWAASCNKLSLNCVTDVGDMVVTTKCQPLGVILVVFNVLSDLENCIDTISAAIAFGNTVIVQVVGALQQQTKQQLQEFWHKSQLPKGVINIIHNELSAESLEMFLYSNTISTAWMFSYMDTFPTDKMVPLSVNLKLNRLFFEVWATKPKCLWLPSQ